MAATDTAGERKIGCVRLLKWGYRPSSARGGIDFACLRTDELFEDGENRGYVWHNKELTHTRLYENEILDITRTIVERLNRSAGKTEVILPMGGLRTLSYPGGFFHKPGTIQKMKEIFEEGLKPEIVFKAYDLNFVIRSLPTSAQRK